MTGARRISLVRLAEAKTLLGWSAMLDRKQMTYDEYLAGVCRPERAGARRREPHTRPRRKETPR